MAISRLVGQTATNTAAAASVAATYPGATTANNLLIAVVYANDSAGTPAITGWTSVINPATSGQQSALFFKIASGSESIITATDTGATDMGIAIYEYTGNATASVLDKSASNSDGVTPALTASTGTTTTTTQADEYAIAFAYWETSSQTFASATNSFSSLSSVGNHLIIVDRTLVATGTFTTSITVTGTNDTWSAGIATFKAAAVAVVSQARYIPVKIANRNVGPNVLRRRFHAPQVPQYANAPAVGVIATSSTLLLMGVG